MDKDKIDEIKKIDIEKYHYFDIDRIRRLADISEISMKNGRQLEERGNVVLRRISAGYTPYSDSMCVDAEASGHSEDERRNSDADFEIHAVFSRDEIVLMECGCQQCRRGRNPYYYSMNRKINCAYMSALLDQTEKFLNEHNIGDATDRGGNRFLKLFKRERERTRSIRQRALTSGFERQAEAIELVPRLTKNNDELELSFRIGSSKKFLIKNFSNFCEHVKNAENAVYGSKTEISHDPEDFTSASRGWLEFIMRIVQEDTSQYEHMLELSRAGTLRRPRQSMLRLYGWRLDSFFELARETHIEYEDKDQSIKAKSLIGFDEGEPDIRLRITHLHAGDDGESGSEYSAEKPYDAADMAFDSSFDGIEVSADIPYHWDGMSNTYFIVDDTLYKSSKEFSDGIRLLFEGAADDHMKFRIGRQHISEFYNDVLPEIEGYVTVEETEHDNISRYISPQAVFTFYLDTDAYDGRITCKCTASYGDVRFSLNEEQPQDIPARISRQYEREEEAEAALLQLFSEYDPVKDIYICSDDEDQMYYLVSEGISTLGEYGEIMMSEQFRRTMNTSRQIRVSVGVSVSNDLLDLTITTDDISQSELLDILRAYKPNKKFYRLKNGDFIDMQSEPLVMLTELLQSVNALPKDMNGMKDILGENIKVPAYRTLYINTLLDANKSVYAERDKNFRQLVRSFRDVSDSELAEPASLSGVMRGYQKEGFRWLKMLGSYGFGGILADDMGLGKTLQAVAVLLSEAEARGRKEGATSIVISPASLIYNWLEEIKCYAPQLRVLVVAGSQQQRRALIEEWQSYDVLITSYDLLKRDISFYEGKSFLYEIIDEAQYIKNHTTAAAKAVKVIQSRRKLALTGTPVENRLSELWSIFDFLMPGFLYTYETFKNKFEAPVVKYADESALKRLQQMVSPFILRRLKKDVLRDLPDKLEENRVVQLGEKQQRLYDAQVVHMQNILTSQSDSEFGKNKIQILAELMKLRQICCDPSLCFYNYDGGSAKLDACMDLIESAIDGEHRILLFSQFTSMLSIIAGELEKRGIGYYQITGSTPKKDRIELVRAFNAGTVPVFLISLKAGGTGLNLTGADIVIHYDPWWNIAAQNQATDRAHRIGQTRNVTVYRMIVKNSIEEKIQKLQEAKHALAESVVGAADGISLASLTQEELLKLIG